MSRNDPTVAMASLTGNQSTTATATNATFSTLTPTKRLNGYCKTAEDRTVSTQLCLRMKVWQGCKRLPHLVGSRKKANC